MTPELSSQVMREVVAPVLSGMAAEGHAYRGFLYVGLMLTADGPKVIEFNVRFGDPEAQVILPAIEGHFAQALLDAARGHLGDAALVMRSECLVGVTIASAGYPARADNGRMILGLDRAAAQTDVLVFHAGTKATPGGQVTAGGRVLTIVGRGPTYETAMQRAYDAVRVISFEGMQYRRDIGKKAILAMRPLGNSASGQ
jgi:phosphoribosylamine--glycine ligase